jgi:hypothetical protein
MLRKMTKTKANKFLYFGVFVLLAILIFNSFFVFSIGPKINAKIKEAKELAKPAKIEIIKIKSSCIDCFDIEKIISALKDSNLEIINEKSLTKNSQEAIELIKKYNIKKLPTIILKGEIEKASVQNFEQVEDALVFRGVNAPYEDAITGDIIGKVSTIIITDKNCDVCVDLNILVDDLKQNGVVVDNQKEFEFSDPEAKELINKMGIKKIPVLTISKDIDAYPNFAQAIQQLEFKENNKDYIIESQQPPYTDAQTGKIKGLVDMIMLEDSRCSECYDVEIHKKIINRFGVAISKEDKIDINSDKGQQLIRKYNIEGIPTIILKGDLEEYTIFNTVWQKVGTVEDDGAYVFRNLNAIGERGMTYKNITTGDVVSTTTT